MLEMTSQKWMIQQAFLISQNTTWHVFNLYCLLHEMNSQQN